jgi:hypothetical protein
MLNCLLCRLLYQLASSYVAMFCVCLLRFQYVFPIFQHTKCKGANEVQDVQGTIHALEVSGLTGKTEV